MDATTMRRSPVPVYAFLGLCASLITLHFVLPQGELPQAMTYFSVGFVSFLAMVAGILLHRPARTVHLWLFAAALGLFSLGDAISRVYDWVLEVVPFPSIADVAYLFGHAFMVGAFLVLLRSRQRPSLSDALDGAVVLAGASLLLWFVLVRPIATDAALSPVARVVSTAYPAADVLLIVVFAQLLLATGSRSFSFRAIALGVAVLFATEVVYGAETLAGSYADGGWLDAGWMISTTLWGAAVLHPSVRTLHQRTPLRSVTFTRRRLALLAAAGLVAPIAILLYRDGEGFDSALIAGAAAVTTLLVFARMALLFREHEQAVAALREAETARALEESTRVANERFQSAARALECAIYEWEPARDRIAWSDGLSVAFGYPPELADSSNTWFLEHVHPEDREAVAATLDRLGAGEQSGQSSYRFLAGDGTYRHVLDRWIVRRAPDGSVAGVIGGMVDVTQSRELERQLRQAQKMEAVGRLAGGIAHDFNNLLTAVAGNAELLARSPRLAAGEREDVAQIRRAAGQAAELTRRLLAFSRNDARAPSVVELNDAVAAAAAMLRRLLGADITIVEELGGDVGAVRSDAVGIEQIVVNLALNARDAMPRGGTLRLRTAAEGDTAILSVEDEGVGMDAETSARALEPFFTTKEVGKGTGLGLASVYGIVQRAGGTIEIASEVGSGTLVTIRLPQTDPPEEVEGSEERGEAAGSELVLLVEDEPAVRDLTSRVLEAFGYEVVAVPGATDALELMRDPAFRPAVLVSDLSMPGVGGAALASRLRELRPGLPVLFISGYSDVGELEHPLLAKPFTAAELTRAVRQVLASSAAV